MTTKMKGKTPMKRRPAPREPKVGTMQVIQEEPYWPEINTVSVGTSYGGKDPDYCVFRGDREECIELLEDALRAMRDVVRRQR